MLLMSQLLQELEWDDMPNLRELDDYSTEIEDTDLIIVSNSTTDNTYKTTVGSLPHPGTPASGSSFNVTNSSTQVFSPGSLTKVQYSNYSIDKGSEFNFITNSFVATDPGLYFFSVVIVISSTDAIWTTGFFAAEIKYSGALTSGALVEWTVPDEANSARYFRISHMTEFSPSGGSAGVSFGHSVLTCTRLGVGWDYFCGWRIA